MMFDLPIGDPLPWLHTLALAGLRPLAMSVVLPPLGGVAVPWRVRFVLVAALAAFDAFRPGAPPLGTAMAPAELLAGLVAGLSLAAAFAAAQLAGEVAAQMMGLGFATMPTAAAGSVVAGLQGWLMGVAFLITDGHVAIMRLSVAAMVVAPGSDLSGPALAALGSLMFAGGMRLALPVVAVLLLTQLLVGIVARAASPFGAMAVGPAALLLVFVTLLPRVLDRLLGRMAALLAMALT